MRKSWTTTGAREAVVALSFDGLEDFDVRERCSWSASGAAQMAGIKAEKNPHKIKAVSAIERIRCRGRLGMDLNCRIGRHESILRCHVSCQGILSVGRSQGLH